MWYNGLDCCTVPPGIQCKKRLLLGVSTQPHKKPKKKRWKKDGGGGERQVKRGRDKEKWGGRNEGQKNEPYTD